MKLDDIQAIKTALKRLYLNIFRDIKTSPLDSDTKNRKKIEEIYINLSLLIDQTSESYREMSYEKVIEVLESNKKRIAFLGEAGVGKTTLLIKIAYDWALGNCLQDIELLLYVPLRELSMVKCLADILEVYSSRRIEINAKKVEQYVKSNQRKAMLLLDGLDEYDLEISNEDQTDALLRFIRGEDIKDTPIIVTSRPWRGDQVINVQNERYLSVLVKGFSKEDVKLYIKKFFGNDLGSAKGLIQLLTEDSLVAKNMAPYPIFCSMLCNMWKETKSREKIKTLQTFSQLFEEMVSSLTAHWLSKHSFREYRRECDKSLMQIGKVAFDGLLSNKHTFSEKVFEGCKEAKKTACEIGVLSTGRQLGLDECEIVGERAYFSFPHKLFQEYLAGLYLSTLYLEDSAEFHKLIQDKVLTDYQKFRYLLYFTLSHGKETGRGGKALMKAICERVDDQEFVMDVAFESHDKRVIAPAIEFVNELTRLRLWEDLQLLHHHTWSGYMHVLGLCGQEMVKH